MGERRESNPRMLEPQPSALTTWLRSPISIQHIIPYYLVFLHTIKI
jgi:hypothetical protein